MTVEIPLDQIVPERATMIRAGIDQSTVEHYTDVLEDLPPVDLYRLDDGRLITASGHHRLAAARKRGWTTIPAIIHDGTLTEAIDFAAEANATHGKPLTPEERRQAIFGFRERHPEWSNQAIAARMHTSHNDVARILKAQEVRVALTEGVPGYPPAPIPTDRHLREIQRRPREEWEPLARAAQERGWTGDETALAVQNLGNESLPESHKQALLAGEEDPIVISKNGEPAMLTDTIGRAWKEHQEENLVGAYHKMLNEIAAFFAHLSRREATLKDLVEQMRPEVLDDALGTDYGLQHYVSRLEELLAIIKDARRKVTVVK